ncbi:putative NAD(P)H quinone reductase [Calothrix sp. NIES-4071]|nr:putative NAD(P)H quinone reductase [Calothrix sp. NIES-4071]BAZ57435.1 putative NAD(P)H quinone reductase [Calothrix sp. NIES-4105]
MKVFIVHAHPEIQSLNSALTRHARDILQQTGHEVIISDLYSMNFDPVSDRRNFTSQKDSEYFKQQNEENYATANDSFSLDIKAEMEKLFWCDVLIFQFPLWWFGLPGILKGWVDKVFAAGKIYGSGKWYDNGVFQGKKAMLSLTTGGKLPMYTEVGLHGDIHSILYPIHHGILRYVGFDVLPPFIVFGVTKINDERRKGYLREYEERLLSINETYPIIYPALADFDENFQLKSSNS